MNILITGVHGFVGTNLILELKDKNIIYGIDIIFPKKDGIISTFSWSLLESNNLPDVDIIIHLAGKVHDSNKQSEATAYFDINNGLTRKIYDYFLSSTTKKFIFLSSVKAVTENVIGNVLTEDAVPNPNGPYGESKRMAEKYILDHSPSTDSGKSIYILRPCMIHGPGNKGNLNLLYRLINKGIPWPLGAFENQRSFTSIDNLCFIIDRIVSGNVESGIYNIADDETFSTNELIKLMFEEIGYKTQIWNLPKWLVNYIAQLGSMMNLSFNSERLRKISENYVVSNAKIKNAIGIDKMPVTARLGLRKTIRSFNSSLHVF